MTRMRIRFSKLAEIRYISHLDLMRTISRAIRRAKVPIAFSQGFNPHHLLSMGSALSVGLTSTGEYMDLELTKELSVLEFMEMMKPMLPNGLELVTGELITGKVDSLMAQINIAVYHVRLKTNLSKGGIEQRIRDFYLEDQILIQRQSKKKVREVDLKPLLRELKVLELAGDFSLEMIVQTGSKGNARPEEVIRALAKYDEGIAEVPRTWIHRQGLYVEKAGRLFTPLEILRI